MDPVKRLSGMEAQSDLALDEKQNILQQFSNFMKAAEYKNIEVPIMDNTELFLRKSDGQLAPQMYSFRDPIGQQVSLRPEITTQVMDHYLRQEDNATEQKYQYQGPVFRFSEGQKIRGQFTQIGAEYIGGNGLSEEIELLGLASSFLSEAGFASYQCRLADLSLVNYIIDNFGLSGNSKTKIVENIQILKQGSDKVQHFAERLATTKITGDSNKDAYLSSAIENLSEAQARQVLSGFLGWVNGSIDEGSLGRRSHEDVVSRLIDKLRNIDSLDNIQQCLEIVGGLIKINGEPSSAIGQARTLFQSQSYPLDLIEQFENRINGLAGKVPTGCELVVDFGLVKDFGYYTGIIFEIMELTTNQLIGGGGRYDGLATLLGANERVNALGFAFDLDKILEIRVEAMSI